MVAWKVGKMVVYSADYLVVCLDVCSVVAKMVDMMAGRMEPPLVASTAAWTDMKMVENWVVETDD